jgi:glycosyltransferase involved in cell wall biosynthesis
MLLELPSLRFQPRFYSGGVARFHLPLLYDLVTLRQPSQIVTLGYGDGQPHFTFCQALDEGKTTGHCLTIRREWANERAEDDEAWQKAVAESAAQYSNLATLIAGPPAAMAAQQTEGSVDLLFVDDCDDCEMLREELYAWLPKVAPDGLFLFHGLALQRTPPPRRAWEEIVHGKSAAEYIDGMGLGVASAATSPLLGQIFGTAQEREELAAFYRLSAERIDAEHRAREAERRNLALELQHVWFDTVLADRWQAQKTMDEQAREIAERAEEKEERTRAFNELHQDRVKAQLIMDTQSEQLKHWVNQSEALRSHNKKLKAQLTETKQALGEARKKKRSIPERIVRELRRIPKNLGRAKAPALPEKKKKAASVSPNNRYADWIEKHEPEQSALEEQRITAAALPEAPLLSLILPTFKPPAVFFDQLVESLAAQTYQNFEVCIADGGSDAETKKRLQRWQEKESRVRLKFLAQNLGIAENTNHALALATGQFFLCIDQDDLLAPFALYEMAHAIVRQPEADVFYSDEDRLTSKGERQAPFFKPEWNPELLLSYMYLGHLTAYRRSLVEKVGTFRKEFELSQDYDFAFRATEAAGVIVHVPHVLYHWREHSASGSTGGKPNARATNLAALGAAMQRRGLEAEIIELPTANRARLKPAAWPRVSLIIPTDSVKRARASLEQLPRNTEYADYEIILVTNSRLVDSLQADVSSQPPVRFVRYDKPFNFSEKCNRGAEIASGSRLLFVNDDVESIERDWIQNVIEPLENPEIGAVAPKLLYATGKIQHAGLVTGVRGLVGTACHQWPGDSSDYVNFAQSMRDVSALSGACLALRKEDFDRVGGFNAIDTPIFHSDIDLCFALRAAGLRCVYTPFATLRHAGHASLGEEERIPEAAPRRDKSSIYLLRRWGENTTHDPYFTDYMRDWLYADSPTPIRMFGRNEERSAAQLDLLFISHDLSLSGAPILMLHLARWCRANDYFVTVMAPNDGPLRAQYQAAGIPLILDPLILKEHESFSQFLRNFDALLANTVQGWPAIRAAKKEHVPALWWLHETLVGEHYLREDKNLRLSIREADVIFTPSARTAAVYKPFAEQTPRCIPYGIPDLAAERTESAEPRPNELRFLLLGSVERRKGQDAFVQALRLLPRELQRRAKFQIAGRVMDPEFAIKVYGLAEGLENLQITGEIEHAGALALLEAADVLVCASRDEAMPVTILEAMSLGKAIVSTTAGGVPEYIRDQENGFLVRPEKAAELAAAIERLLQDPAEARRLGRNARATFEEQFSLDRFGSDFINLVREMISTKN